MLGPRSGLTALWSRLARFPASRRSSVRRLRMTRSVLWLCLPLLRLGFRPTILSLRTNRLWIAAELLARPLLRLRFRAALLRLRPNRFRIAAEFLIRSRRRLRAGARPPAIGIDRCRSLAAGHDRLESFAAIGFLLPRLACTSHIGRRAARLNRLILGPGALT